MTTAVALPPRLALLVRLVRRQGGEWTRARVERAYKAAGVQAPKHHTHRHDLRTLHRMGVLDLRDTPGRRYYLPARATTDQPVRGNR